MAGISLKEMTVDNLKELDLKDLLSLQGNLNEAIKIRKETEKRELLEKMKVMASESGYSLDELLGKKAKKTVKVKYRNPNNASESWSGRGKKPKWVQNLIDSGKSLEDLEVK